MPHIIPVAGALVMAMLPLTGAAAQEHVHPQATAEKLGRVYFETSCAPEDAPDFNGAVALLHSFEFGSSLRAFSAVVSGDSTCAMAYWWLALSHWGNPMAFTNRAPALLQRGREAANTAMRLGGNATARERDYISAVSASALSSSCR